MTEIKEIDFSIFHPLDHRPGSKRCRDHYPKGWKSLPYCLKLNWEYRWSEKIKRKTLCRIGHHEMTPYWKGKTFGDGVPPAGTVCRNCNEKGHDG